MDYNSGRLVIVEVAPLAGGSRVEPANAAFDTLRGTSTGLNIGEQEFTTAREFGEANKNYEDGEVVARNFGIPFAGKYHPQDEGYLTVEAAALAVGSDAEVFVRLYPLGKSAGAPIYKGVCSVMGLQVTMPREGELTGGWTFKGRGELTKASHAA